VDWAERARALIETLPDAKQGTAARDWFAERAAIAEHDGHLTRADAERLACEELAAGEPWR
jgi:hypothetical protein